MKGCMTHTQLSWQAIHRTAGHCDAWRSHAIVALIADVPLVIHVAMQPCHCVQACHVNKKKTSKDAQALLYGSQMQPKAYKSPGWLKYLTVTSR